MKMQGKPMIWPFKAKPNGEYQSETDPPKKTSITLSASDDAITRAVNIMNASGLVVNNVAYNQIVPWMAHAIRAYQDLDRAAFQNEAEQKNEQKTG